MIEYQKTIEMLSSYLKKRGIYLAKGNWDAYFHEDKVVVYNYKLRNKENMIFSILHEIGHHLAFTNRKTYKNRFPVLYKQRFGEGNINKRTNRYRMEVIIEEHDAWKRGERLAKKLKLDINGDRYYTYASRWIKSYYEGIV
jgi:Zn-dependent peptidase ImmA (M78 family)